MSWRLVRRIWVTLCNLAGLGMMGVGFLMDYQIAHLAGGARPPRTIAETFGPLFLVTLLVMGVVLEWLDCTWPALVINAGFFAVFGFGVLGKALWMVLTKPAAQYDPEAALAVAIVGVPFAVIAMLDFVLYWNTRAKSNAV